MFENAIKNRFDFVILYDVENGNPNGDPDAGNMPRIDPETGHGIVTDVCIKRKIRNWVDVVKSGEKGYDIYIKQDKLLNDKDAEAVDNVRDIQDRDERENTFRSMMCENYFDIRTFGAVMTTAGKKNSDVKLRNTAGQVRGPVQLAFGRSVDPIVTQEISITRMAIANEKDKDKANTMGNKYIVPYGLYRQEGFISANLAQKATGFSETDLGLFWQAVVHMFDEDHSAARGKMVLRELIIFRHENELGSAPSHKLFELVEVKCQQGVISPRSYSDYIVTVNSRDLPVGVNCERR